jgi:predicted SnoaL-like aldol condensation-catalyzing enzyme
MYAETESGASWCMDGRSRASCAAQRSAAACYEGALTPDGPVPAAARRTASWGARWSSNYIQHSAHIPPGRDGLFNLIRSTPATLKYEPGAIVAEGDYVIVHGRFSNIGRPKNWIAADVVRVADGMLAEHWDVVQDEASEAESQSGLPMFGTNFPVEK